MKNVKLLKSNIHHLHEVKYMEVKNMFSGKRFVTCGVSEKVPIELQLIMWNLIDTLDIKKDYLQVFDLSEDNGTQKIIHSQEDPPYKKEYSFKTNTPFLSGKIFVIDDETHSTMLFSYEY